MVRMRNRLAAFGVVALVSGCLTAEDEAPMDDGLGTVAQETAVADYGIALAYGYNARSRARGFDWGALTIPIVIVESNRREQRVPVMILGTIYWIDVWDSSLSHSSSFYKKLLFGDSDRNAADFFAEESHGNLTLSYAGRSNRLDMRNAPTATGDYEKAIKVAAGATALGDFDFKPYDTNGDGSVDNTELWIVHIEGGTAAGPHNGGSNRSSSPACPTVATRTGSVKVCSTIIHLGDTVGFETVVHELSHVLGAYDLYGRWNVDSNFEGATVMGATIFNTPDDRRTVYHDAWHRFQFGWERPAVYDILSPAERAGSHFLLPPGQWNGFGNTIIFGGISTGRYLMVEYRKPEGYDQDVRGDALYVWSVEQDADKSLAKDASFRNYNTLYLGHEICLGGNYTNDGPGLSGCAQMGNWDSTVPVDGTWRQFYMPNSFIHPRVRATKSGSGVRVEWETMQCAHGSGSTSRCWKYEP